MDALLDKRVGCLPVLHGAASLDLVRGFHIFGRRVGERSLVPLGEARLGHIGLDEWLRRSQPKA